MGDRWEEEENRGQEGQHHRDEEQTKRGQKKEDGRGEGREGREGRVGVLIETRTKASGGRAETAGETAKKRGQGELTPK